METSEAQFCVKETAACHSNTGSRHGGLPGQDPNGGQRRGWDERTWATPSRPDDQAENRARGAFGVESGCSEAVCLVRSHIVRERHDAFKGSGQDQKRGMCNGMFCLCYTGALELVL
jgi:hypothetical protein